MKKRIKICDLIIALFLISGCMSCKKEQGDPELLDDSINIENLQTRLRIVESGYRPEEIWRANPKDIIMNYRSSQEDKGKTYFGYTDNDDKIILCEVINFPDSAKQWNGEFVYKFSSYGKITEIDIQISGKVRLFTDDNGEKYGTFEVTSLKPAGFDSSKPELQLGVYVSTYPQSEYTRTIINFIDNERLILERFGFSDDDPSMFNYEIVQYSIILNDPKGVIQTPELFFRVINNSTFEIVYLYVEMGEKSGWTIMTFERVQ